MTARTYTPEQLVAKRARQARWYQDNRERLCAEAKTRELNRTRRKIATRIDIECAIARGLDVHQIVAQLGVTAARVHETWDYLDECAGVAS